MSPWSLELKPRGRISAILKEDVTTKNINTSKTLRGRACSGRARHYPTITEAFTAREEDM